MKVETAAHQMEALGNPTRLRVYRILVRAGKEGLPVGRLQSRLGIAASTLSHHLRRLIESGLVSVVRVFGTSELNEHWRALALLVQVMPLGRDGSSGGFG